MFGNTVEIMCADERSSDDEYALVAVLHSEVSHVGFYMYMCTARYGTVEALTVLCIARPTTLLRILAATHTLGTSILGAPGPRPRRKEPVLHWPARPQEHKAQPTVAVQQCRHVAHVEEQAP